MHSFLYRLNAVLTFSVLAFSAICFSASMTDIIHTSNPTVDIKVVKFEGLWRTHGGNDELLVFVAAEYVTHKNSWNQISLWDSIVTSKKDAKFKLLTCNKYSMIDQGNNLRGAEFNLTCIGMLCQKRGGCLKGRLLLPDSSFQVAIFTRGKG